MCEAHGANRAGEKRRQEQPRSEQKASQGKKRSKKLVKRQERNAKRLGGPEARQEGGEDVETANAKG